MLFPQLTDTEKQQLEEEITKEIFRIESLSPTYHVKEIIVAVSNMWSRYFPQGRSISVFGSLLIGRVEMGIEGKDTYKLQYVIERAN